MTRSRSLIGCLLYFAEMYALNAVMKFSRCINEQCRTRQMNSMRTSYQSTIHRVNRTTFVDALMIADTYGTVRPN